MAGTVLRRKAVASMTICRRFLSASTSVAQQEARLREELAAAHLLQVRYSLDDLVWNHLSARCPWAPERFLVTPGNKLFDEIDPDDLVVVDTAANDTGSHNVTANVIHAAFYESRPDVCAVVHNHSRACMSVSCLSGGLHFLTQDSAGFFGQVGYHAWEGLSDDTDEKVSLGRDLGDAHTLVMHNHGVAVVGNTVGEAWVRNYFLDRICQVQVDLLPALVADEQAKAAAASGRGSSSYEPLVVQPGKVVLQHAAAQMEAEFRHGKFEWGAMMRWYHREKAKGKRGEAARGGLWTFHRDSHR